MYLGNNLKPYESIIKENIFYYAYENHVPKPILNIAIPDWVGQIFDTANIDNELHEDLIEDLKYLKLYDKIKTNTDKFVILPDVFSVSEVPPAEYSNIKEIPFSEQMEYPVFPQPRNQYDDHKRNIVIINNKVFEIYSQRLKDKYEYWYNHNGKFYYFYKNTEEMQELFNPNIEKPSIKVLTIKDNGVTSDLVNYNEWNYRSRPDKGYALYLDKDNHYINPSDAINNHTPAASLYINMPYVKLDYTKLSQDKLPEMPGLISAGWRDMDMRPKWYNFDNDNFFIQNPDVIYSSTALVIKKDGTWDIENLYMNDEGKYLTRVDKHTVKFKAADDVKEIIMFTIPYRKPNFIRPDSLYYKAIMKNPQIAETLRAVKKDTSWLYDLISKRPCIDIEELIKLGYERDVDILKTIQNTFPRISKINILDIEVSQYYGTAVKENNEEYKYVYYKMWHRDLTKDFDATFGTSTLLAKLKQMAFNEIIMALDNFNAFIKDMLGNRFEAESDTVTVTQRFENEVSRFKLITQHLVEQLRYASVRINIQKDFPDLPEIIAWFDELLSKPDEWFYVMQKVKQHSGQVHPDHVFYNPKILIKVWNPLNKYPVLIVNNIVYPIDYKIIKDHDLDILVIDPVNLYEFYISSDTSILTESKIISKYAEQPTGREEAYNRVITVANMKKISAIKNLVLGNLDSVKVVLADWTEMSDGINKHIHGRICRDAYTAFSYIDEFSSPLFNKSIYKGEPFVNGLLTSDDTGTSSVNLSYAANFVGPESFNGTTPVTDNNQIFQDFNSTVMVNAYSFLYGNGKDKKFYSTSRINMGTRYDFKDDAPVNNNTTLQKLHTALDRDNQLIAFNTYGLEVTDEVDILSKEYINTNNMRIDLSGLEYKGRAYVIFSPSYKSHESEYDLTIDADKVSPGNKSYNERAAAISDIVDLFDTYETVLNGQSPIKKIDAADNYNKIRNVLMNTVGTKDEALSELTYGYNPMDLILGAYRLKHMLEESGLTYIIEHKTQRFWDNESIPHTILEDYLHKPVSNVYINASSKYKIADYALGTNASYNRVPENTLVVKQNSDILRRFTNAIL